VNEEHEVLDHIFKKALKQIHTAKDAGNLPNIRTSLLPYILNMAEDAILPVIDKNDENYSMQLFAISAGFGWTIKQFMPFDVFLSHMNSQQMKTAHKVLEDMLKRESVTREDVDAAFEKESRTSTPGVG
jgi:hypothetical protein